MLSEAQPNYQSNNNYVLEDLCYNCNLVYKLTYNIKLVIFFLCY